MAKKQYAVLYDDVGVNKDDELSEDEDKGKEDESTYRLEFVW